MSVWVWVSLCVSEWVNVCVCVSVCRFVRRVDRAAAGGRGGRVHEAARPEPLQANASGGGLRALSAQRCGTGDGPELQPAEHGELEVDKWRSGGIEGHRRGPGSQ